MICQATASSDPGTASSLSISRTIEGVALARLAYYIITLAGARAQTLLDYYCARRKFQSAHAQAILYMYTEHILIEKQNYTVTHRLQSILVF